MIMKTLKFFSLPILLSDFFLIAWDKPAFQTGIKKKNDATKVLKDFSKMKESIPHQLIEEYEGIVIIPKLINAGFGIGGKRGQGVAMVKLPNGQWSDPVFITLTGGSIGFQIGVQSVDMVLVFRNKGVLAKVESGDFTIGGDVSAAAGPVGRSSTASTDMELQAEVYSYSRSKGLFAGISINGSNLAINKSANQAYYGEATASADIFARAADKTAAVTQLKAALKAL
jgi:lipid-binding SYLF domain-containing protein